MAERASAPELSQPCPRCPDYISHQVFQDFIEHGKVPDDLSDVVKLGIWCMQNAEPKALAHLSANWRSQGPVHFAHKKARTGKAGYALCH